MKSQKRKLFEKRNKLLKHQNQMSIYGTRNSYSKTDHDATFIGVQFKFHVYRQKKDKDGVVKDVKEYRAEKLDVNQNVILAALTPKGNLRKITVNSAWEYHKAKQR